MCHKTAQKRYFIFEYITYIPYLTKYFSIISRVTDSAEKKFKNKLDLPKVNHLNCNYREYN